MFLLQNAVCKILRPVTGQNGNFAISQNRTGIQLRHNLMHRASRQPVTGLQGAPIVFVVVVVVVFVVVPPFFFLCCLLL